MINGILVKIKNKNKKNRAVKEPLTKKIIFFLFQSKIKCIVINAIKIKLINADGDCWHKKDKTITIGRKNQIKEEFDFIAIVKIKIEIRLNMNEC